MAKKPNGKDNQLPEELEMAFEQDAGLGLEDVNASDMQIPFLRI